MNPYPGAWTTFKSVDENFRVKIFEVELILSREESEIFAVEITDDYLHVCLKECKIAIKELQFPNKKRMKINEFLNGWRSNMSLYVE